MISQDILNKQDDLKVGDKVYFLSQTSPMTLKARSQRYLILTEPFYRNKTVYYSIVDLDNQWKAPNDRIVNPYNYEEQADIDECLHDLILGKVELSKKRGVKLNIDWERTEARKNKTKKNKK